MAASNRNQQLARVHVLKKELGLDDDTYRDIVERVTGSRSAKDASDRKLADLVADLAGKAGGFKPSSRADIRMIWAIWAELGRQGKLRDNSRRGLRAFCANRSGATGAEKDPDHLTPEEARKVIEALKDWEAR